MGRDRFYHLDETKINGTKTKTSKTPSLDFGATVDYLGILWAACGFLLVSFWQPFASLFASVGSLLETLAPGEILYKIIFV